MNFYKLTCFDNSPMVEWEDGNFISDIECLVYDGHQRRGKRKENLTVRLPLKIGDVLWTWFSDMLITERAKRLFEEAGFTGFQLKSVVVNGLTKKAQSKAKADDTRSLPALWEVMITGWAGMAPPESGIRFIESKSCKSCGLLVYSSFCDPSRLMDMAQWDGSDFFMIWPLPNYIFVTERVALFIKQHKLKDCHLIPLEKIPVKDRELFDHLSPGRLSDSMPEARAHILGDPLGIF